MSNLRNLEQEVRGLRERVRQIERLPTAPQYGYQSGQSHATVWRPRYYNVFDSTASGTVINGDFLDTNGGPRNWSVDNAVCLKYHTGQPPTFWAQRTCAIKFDPPVSITHSGLYALNLSGYYYAALEFEGVFAVTLYALPLFADWTAATSTYNNWTGTYDPVYSYTTTAAGVYGWAFSGYHAWTQWISTTPIVEAYSYNGADMDAVARSPIHGVLALSHRLHPEYVGVAHQTPYYAQAHWRVGQSLYGVLLGMHVYMDTDPYVVTTNLTNTGNEWFGLGGPGTDYGLLSTALVTYHDTYTPTSGQYSGYLAPTYFGTE